MIHDGDNQVKNENVNQATAGTFGMGNTNTDNSNDILNAKSLGFYSGDMKLMTSNKAADYAISIYKGIQNVYEANNEASRTNVILLDKNVTAGLEYSYIVVSRKSGETINYFVVVLEATGREPMTAEEIIAEYTSVIKNRHGARNLFTTGDAINGELSRIIAGTLREHYKVGPNAVQEIISADGLIVPYAIDDTELVARTVAAIAYNALSALSVIQNPANADLNIAEGNKQTNNAVLDIVSSISKSTATDELGTPIRADFKIELGVRQNNTQNNNINYAEELNKVNTNTVLSKVCGFVDAYPDELKFGLPNGSYAQQMRFRPHIIVTDIAVEKPTIGFMFMGLLSSLIMTNKDMWLANVLPDGGKHNVGVLNAIADIEGNGTYDILDLDASAGKSKEKKYSPEKVYSIVAEMFKLDPIISVDVPDYGPHTFYTSVLSAAASGVANNNTRGALRTIVETAHVLTNGVFPLDFPINEIFAHEGVLIPLGTWREPKTGILRDIRDIDLTFVMAETGDMDVVRKWHAASAPARVSNLDPYLTKVDIISMITPKAKITGRGVRVTFTNKFIAELSNSAINAGFAVRYEPEAKLLEQNNLSITSGLINNAVLNNVAGFARQNVVAGPNLRMNYINSGFGRFGLQ